MMRLFSAEPPRFRIKLLFPEAKIIVNTPIKKDYDRMIFSPDPAALAGYLAEMYAGVKVPFTFLTGTAFIAEYLAALKAYREKHIDIMKIPERTDFSGKSEKPPFPVMTYAERLVREHSGLDFERQAELPVTEFWILLADAVKSRIMERPDGIEYLQQCYNDMHRISNIKANVR